MYSMNYLHSCLAHTIQEFARHGEVRNISRAEMKKVSDVRRRVLDSNFEGRKRSLSPHTQKHVSRVALALLRLRDLRGQSPRARGNDVHRRAKRGVLIG